MFHIPSNPISIILSIPKSLQEKKKNPTGFLWKKGGIGGVCILTLCFCFCLGCNQPSDSQMLESNAVLMGTTASQKLYGTQDERIADEIWQLVGKLETELLSRREEGSEVALVNQKLKTEKVVTISKALSEYLQLGQEIWRSGEGCFDLTLGELTSLWNIDEQVGEENPLIPTAEEIAKAKERSGFANLTLVSSHSVQVETPVMLDLGAVGKGIALDEVAGYLEGEPAVTCAIISLGGSVLTYGEKQDHSPFQIAVVDPNHRDKVIGCLKLEGRHFVSTSGAYERFFEVDNTRFHHILDPVTGYPAKSDVLSATVVSDSGYLSDALSTACFILGSEKGLTLAKMYQAQVLFVTTSGEILMSEELEGKFVKD